jgi:hypothetical protein
MQSARSWWRHSFCPATVDDYLKIEAALGTHQNVWLGQVISYWGMAAALVAQGTLGEPALLSSEFSEELFEVFCKVRPFLVDLRRRSRKPGLLRNIEELATGSRKSRQRLAIAHKQFVSRRKEVSQRWPKQASLSVRALLLVGLNRQFGDFQLPAVANSCRPIANWPASTGTQYTTLARERKLPSSDRTFKRSLGFQGLLVRIRAPRGLTFSVIPSCAGKRTSRLARSTLIFIGVRSSVRFDISMEHH